MNDHGFGQILDLWEQNLRGKDQKRSAQSTSFAEMLDQYLPDGEVARQKDWEPGQSEVQKKNPRYLPVEDVLDLHGMTVQQAEAVTSAFLKQSKQGGMKKVLIIHGKGNHSAQGGVLKNWLLRFLDEQPCAGARGTGRKEHGGSGALWVVLK